MKIKLSKSQWESIGIRGGWLKEAQQLTLPIKTEPMDIPQTQPELVARIKQYPDLSILRSMEIMGDRILTMRDVDSQLSMMEIYELTDVLRMLIKKFPKKDSVEISHRKDIYNREVINPPSRGRMHRCKQCWTKASKIDNGFIPANQPYPHADSCPSKGAF